MKLTKCSYNKLLISIINCVSTTFNSTMVCTNLLWGIVSEHLHYSKFSKQKIKLKNIGIHNAFIINTLNKDEESNFGYWII